MEPLMQVALTTILLLLSEISMATMRSKPSSNLYGGDRKHGPVNMFAKPRPFPRPLLDHVINGVGRRPFPDFPVTKPNPSFPWPTPTAPTAPPSDPADISNLFSQCSQDPSVNIKSIFSGMFLTHKDLDDLVLETKADMQPYAFSNFKKSERYIEENRFQETIGTVQAMAAPGETTANTCCETRLVITAPSRVVEDGQSMSVVHMNHSYQYVQEGLCTNPDARCRDIGTCTQIHKYAFLLLYDPQLVGKINPPVRYGRVQVKSHCECMNIGMPGK